MYQIKVLDPSGHSRIFPFSFSQTVTIGRAESSHIQLRDLTAPLEAAILAPFSSEPFQVRLLTKSKPLRVGELLVHDSCIPSDQVVEIGESRIWVEKRQATPSVPTPPSNMKSWKTSDSSGIQLIWQTRKIATTRLPVYLFGETGTGKEVLAQLIHGWSPLSHGPFVPLHCGAIPSGLLESELFGHVKGAFTGAIQNRVGALMAAHQGTLFLDEIGDLPIDAQVKLLRFLENGEVRPLGSDRMAHSQVRIICATHKPLEELVEKGHFRRDLYYRLASTKLSIPPLRERPKDIELLSKDFAKELGCSVSEPALNRLKSHHWNGNVRELRHAIERAVGMQDQELGLLKEKSFEFLITPENLNQSPTLAFQSVSRLNLPILSLYEMERHLLLKALKISDGNRTKAAQLLGIARSTLFEKIKRHSIRGPRSQPKVA